MSWKPTTNARRPQNLLTCDIFSFFFFLTYHALNCLIYYCCTKKTHQHKIAVFYSRIADKFEQDQSWIFLVMIKKLYWIQDRSQQVNGLTLVDKKLTKYKEIYVEAPSFWFLCSYLNDVLFRRRCVSELNCLQFFPQHGNWVEKALYPPLLDSGGC